MENLNIEEILKNFKDNNLIINEKEFKEGFKYKEKQLKGEDVEKPENNKYIEKIFNKDFKINLLKIMDNMNSLQEEVPFDSNKFKHKKKIQKSIESLNDFGINYDKPQWVNDLFKTSKMKINENGDGFEIDDELDSDVKIDLDTRAKEILKSSSQNGMEINQFIEKLTSDKGKLKEIEELRDSIKPLENLNSFNQIKDNIKETDEDIEKLKEAIKKANELKLSIQKQQYNHEDNSNEIEFTDIEFKNLSNIEENRIFMTEELNEEIENSLEEQKIDKESLMDYNKAYQTEYNKLVGKHINKVKHLNTSNFIKIDDFHNRQETLIETKHRMEARIKDLELLKLKKEETLLKLTTAKSKIYKPIENFKKTFENKNMSTNAKHTMINHLINFLQDPEAIKARKQAIENDGSYGNDMNQDKNWDTFYDEDFTIEKLLEKADLSDPETLKRLQQFERSCGTTKFFYDTLASAKERGGKAIETTRKRSLEYMKEINNGVGSGVSNSLLNGV